MRDGVCNHCQGYAEEHALAAKKKTYEEKFNELIEEHREKAGYDLIMAYSGGKDSTYTLDLFVNRYKLRVLALTFDNSFISPLSFENIRRICSALGVDHYLVRPNPSMLHTVFKRPRARSFFRRKRSSGQAQSARAASALSSQSF